MVCQMLVCHVSLKLLYYFNIGVKGCKIIPITGSLTDLSDGLCALGGNQTVLSDSAVP